MRKRRQGRIVNISSIGGKISVPHQLPYSVGKFALTGFSEGLRAELLKDNVYVTTVCPGLMRTGSPRNPKFKGQHRAEYAWFSISGALPLLSMSAERAARRIVMPASTVMPKSSSPYPPSLQLSCMRFFRDSLPTDRGGGWNCPTDLAMFARSRGKFNRCRAKWQRISIMSADPE